MENERRGDRLQVRRLSSVRPSRGVPECKRMLVGRSIINCPAEWVDKLDDTYLCLPKNTESGTEASLVGLFGQAFFDSGNADDIVDAPAGTADFKSVPFWCVKEE